MAFTGRGIEAQDDPGRIVVIGSDPPTVHVLNRASLKSTAHVRVPENPMYTAVGVRGRFLYVVHNGLTKPDWSTQPAEGRLSVIDTQQGSLVTTIPLGWNVDPPLMSSDQRYLVCFSLSQLDKARPASGSATVTIVDTASNAVTSTLRVAHLGQQVRVTTGAKRVFVLGGGGLWPILKGDQPAGGSVLATFEPPTETPLAELIFANGIAGMVLSADQKWLYLLDNFVGPVLEPFFPGRWKEAVTIPGFVQVNGRFPSLVIHVVDVSTGQLALM